MISMKQFGVAALMLFGGVALAAFLAPSEDKPHRPPELSTDQLITVRENVRQLTRDLEQLTEAITERGKDDKKPSVYRQAEQVLGELAALEQEAKPGADRKELYQRFGKIDSSLHDVLEVVHAIGKGDKAIQRTVVYVQASDAELHFALSAGDSSDAQIPAVVARQSRALVLACRRLNTLAKPALGDVQGRGELETDLQKLFEAAEAFQKTTEIPHSQQQLREAFRPVNQAWDRVVRGLQGLPAKENFFLLRSALRVDQLHERLYRLLGLEGERPRLIIRF